MNGVRQEMTLPEIAEELGITLREVQVAYTMGIRKLRRIKKPVRALRALADQLRAEQERRRRRFA